MRCIRSHMDTAMLSFYSVRRWLLLLLISAPLYAQTTQLVPPETQLVGLSGTAPATEETFTISTAQDLTITLTDLQTPAALASATVVLTQGDAIVQIASGNATATLAPPAAVATVSVPGASGQYTLRVFGAPNASFSYGTFSVCVAPTTNPADCIQDASLSGNISTASSAADPTVSTLSLPLTVTSAGTYTVTYTDDQFPVALNLAPNLALFQGSTPVALSIASGATVNLAPGSYTLLGIAQADQTLKAGLYSISITGPGGVPVLLNDTYPVGQLAAALGQTNPSTQTLSLAITDFAFPSALAAVKALATLGATTLANISTPSAPATFTAPAGVIKMWSFATAGTDAGTFEVDLNAGAATLLTSVTGVPNGNSLAFAYLTAPVTAGTYQVGGVDFDVPSALQTLKFAVAQNDKVLNQSGVAGTLPVSAAAGPLVLLVNATAVANGNGLFGVNVSTSASPAQLVFDKTQGVTLTGVFDSQTVSIGTAGSYDVKLTDLDFPAQFQNLALVVSQGGTVLGEAFDGGTFSISGAAGDYQLTFIATPAAQQEYGMYGLQVVYAPPAVTLTATPTTVPSGSLTTLNWTIANASSCTGSGGAWTASPTNGTASTSIAVAKTTTYTLACTGAGGSTTQTVTVTATAASGKSGGGGLDEGTLLALALLALQRMRSRCPQRRPLGRAVLKA